jgi:hypothetical protein
MMERGVMKAGDSVKTVSQRVTKAPEIFNIDTPENVNAYLLMERLVEEQEKANKAVDFVESVIGRPDDFKDDEKFTFAKVIILSKIENDMDYNRYFTIEELKNVISKLPLPAPGLDMIYPQYVKNLSDKWIKTLLEIINKAWKDEKFPKILKDGVVTMIPKQCKDNSKMENLRMITLLPVLGKVYERMALNGEQIETVNQFKWLGITIDRKLTFKAHLRQLKKT